MKKNDIYEEIGNISPDLIAEADPLLPKVERKTKIMRSFSIIAACFSLLIVSSCLWLFLPYSMEIPEEIEALKGSEYYDLYLNLLLNERNNNGEPKNNYEKHIEPKIFQYYKILHKDEQQYSDYAGDVTSDLVRDSVGSSYVEVTDNQFEGLIEPDLIKRTDTHIFYLGNDDVIYCYSIDGDKSKCCGVYEGFKNRGYGYSTLNFFLTEDCKSLIVVDSTKESLRLVVIDVSDPANMTETAIIDVGDASYVSARIKSGKLIFAYRQRMLYNSEGGWWNTKPNSVNILRSGELTDTVSFGREDIVNADIMQNVELMFFLQIDIESLTVEDGIILLNGGLNHSLTITEEYIISVSPYTVSDEKIISTYPSLVLRSRTCISVLSYGEEGFDFCGSHDFDGTIVSRYAIDVDENVLRVVTTSGSTVHNSVTLENTVEDVSCDLWCYDMKKERMIASVKNFAPEDEDVRSVRFDGDTVYVCTAKMVGGVFIDPVYYFDLSDYRNIKSIDTGNIEGYSELLKPFDNGFLIGIGRTQDSRKNYSALKIEIYADKGDRVEPVCSYVKDLVSFPSSYHSYLFDPENGYIGFAIFDWTRDDDSTIYILLKFDGEKLVVEREEAFPDTRRSSSSCRSVLIDGYIYVMLNSEFRIIKLP
ncbi:MAG: beta-propeller domain-containing protein [Clostridia bacterium]|nr:beta-propeller domain-containing protein [Clostridia bacterium]